MMWARRVCCCRLQLLLLLLLRLLGEEVILKAVCVCVCVCATSCLMSAQGAQAWKKHNGVVIAKGTTKYVLMNAQDLHVKHLRHASGLFQHK